MTVEWAPDVELRGWITVDDREELVTVHLTSVKPYLEGRLIVDRAFDRGAPVPLHLEDGPRALLIMAGDRLNHFVGLGRLVSMRGRL